MADLVKHAQLTKDLMEKSVYVKVNTLESMESVEHAILGQHIMEKTVFVIMVFMEIEIFARLAIQAVENVQAQKLINVQLALISPLY